MRQIRMGVTALLLVCLLLCPLHVTGFAEDDQTGYYAGENGRYSFELTQNKYCYWYQDGQRFAGKFEANKDGFEMNLIGRDYTQDTSFRAQKQKDGSLKVYGGLVDGEQFIKAEKTKEIVEIDQLCSKRIRHSKKCSGKISLTEMMLVDRDDFRITATGYWASGNDEGIRLLVENNGEKELIIRAASVLINDRAADVFFYSRLAPHETDREMLQIRTAMLEALNIGKIEDIKLVFSFQFAEQSEFFSDEVSIPVLDSRNRVPVMIPIGKTIFNSDKLGIELRGYENTGYGIDLYYFIRNNSDSGFTVRTSKTELNGEAGSFYAIDREVEGHSAVLYRGDFQKDDFSSVGKLSSLVFDLKLESSYNNGFAEFERICLEFEPDGQLCGIESAARVDQDSGFWQKNFASTDAQENEQSEAECSPDSSIKQQEPSELLVPGV